MEKRKKTLTDKQLYERNLAEAINTRLILVASNVMNVCKFTKKQLDELDNNKTRIEKGKYASHTSQ